MRWRAGALVDGGTYFTNFIGNGPESILFMLIFMVITYFIVGLGVNNGLEKANFIMMPALIVVAAILAVYALAMPGAIDGLAFYLVPDFSKFSPELVIAALGQTFFTLSLAMGIMVTYGSYLDKATKLTSSVAQIAGLDVRRFAPCWLHDHPCDVCCYGLWRSSCPKLWPFPYVHHFAPGI